MASCAERAPPKLLTGDWGRSEAACAVGLVMRFEPDSVRLADGTANPLTLLREPHYTVREDAGGRIVEIAHRLDRGGRGRLLIAQGGEGELIYLSERIEDVRTGAARAPIGVETAALAAAFPVRPCGRGAIDAGLRGFSFHARATS